MTGPGPLRIRVDGFERVVDGTAPVVLGRDPDCDVVVRSPKASRVHGRLRIDPRDGWIFEDTGSSNGSFVAGRRVQRTIISGGLTVWLGHPEVGEEIVVTATDPPGRPLEPEITLPIVGERQSSRRVSGTVRIGRAPSNDIVVDDLRVSRHHAEVIAGPEARISIVDGNSHNGTFVNGRRVAHGELYNGDVVGVGRHSFQLRDGVLDEYVDSGRVRFAASGLTFRTPNGQTILDDVGFVLEPSSLLAVVGPAGAGKSTLMKALVGSQPATDGRVCYGGIDFYESYEELRSRIGYVPQDDILHPQLKLRPALQYAADLRFPADSAAAERSRRVDEVLGELGLRERAELQIAKLSGGQRKRTNVAQELLTKPSLLLLDEPTTGLDPGLVKSMMELFRQLSDDGRTVIVITHSLQSIELCDLVLMLAPGGRTAYVGPPGELLPYFGRTENADVFQDLERGDTDWPERFRSHAFHRRYVVGPLAALIPVPNGLPGREPPQALQPWPNQLRTLAHRQVAVLTADWRNFVFLALGVLLPGLAVLAVVGRGALNPDTAPHPDARMLLLALVVAATSIAAANGLREIVKELPIYRRDRAAGMSIGAYLGSKFLVFGVVTIVQVTVLVAIGTAGSQATLSVRAVIVLSLAMAAIGALALGLLISSLVGTSEKAMALIAVLFVGEWLFSGAAVDLQGKAPLQAVGYVTSANWGLAAASSGSDLYRLERRCLPGQTPPPGIVGPAPPCDRRWRPDVRWLAIDLLAVAALIGATAAATLAVLRRKDVGGRRSGRRSKWKARSLG